VAEREAGAGVLTTELKVNLLAPAQGEQLVASGCVVIWDAASSAEVAAMKHGGGWVSGVALSADGGRTASGAPDGCVVGRTGAWWPPRARRPRPTRRARRRRSAPRR
jgi:hypothetical protein